MLGFLFKTFWFIKHSNRETCFTINSLQFQIKHEVLLWTSVLRMCSIYSQVSKPSLILINFFCVCTISTNFLRITSVRYYDMIIWQRVKCYHLKKVFTCLMNVVHWLFCEFFRPVFQLKMKPQSVSSYFEYCSIKTWNTSNDLFSLTRLFTFKLLNFFITSNYFLLSRTFEWQSGVFLSSA